MIVSLFSLTEFSPITAVCLPPFHLNGVVLCAFSQAATASAKTVALDKGLDGPKLRQRLPVHVERSGKAGDEQDQEPDDDPLKIHFALPALKSYCQNGIPISFDSRSTLR